MTQALPSTTLAVDPAWIDAYGHLNAAHYVGIFDRVGFELLSQVGVGLDYTEATRCGIYTMNVHVAYLREVLADDPLMLRVRLLEADNKRLLCLMELTQTRDGYLAATMEQLSLHVDLNTRRSTPFPAELAQRLARTVTEHAAHPLPQGYRRLLPLTGTR
ncbi:thioesterase family protein [Achromobacter spanius]|uniref:thioesterase family protein n=1 Tax=Achromobacter TaxID=222 RepID=UPI000F8F9AB5|nr:MULTISPECIES: thioesterase family protein [Achromobacter]AZS79307.1 thioesterase [Achromobacter spanius]MCD0497618.1 thioesterase family protein [Achromobacter sp. MY14]MCW3153822.1 thioesterase family protein [Achromobacter spanius]